jgi:hypothetical protein
MRNLLYLIIIAAGAYYGWKTWQEKPQWLVKLVPSLQSTAPADPGAAPGGVPGAPAAPGGVAQIPGAPTPEPLVFKSRIAMPAGATVAPGEVAKMPPGTFLVTARASVETDSGVIAIVPGDQVKLLERRNDGTLKVTDGKVDFVVKESQVTQDLAVAQAAERADWEKRFGHR